MRVYKFKDSVMKVNSIISTPYCRRQYSMSFLGKRNNIDTQDKSQQEQLKRLYTLRTNVFALNSIKRNAQNYYPDATDSDIEILTDTSFEAPSKRVTWFNPKNCKVYNLIKVGINSDGSIRIKILDEKGKFIKTADIEPKTVLIIDKFKEPAYYIRDGNFRIQQTPHIPHGQMVARYAFVNNPFANYIYADIQEEYDKDGNIRCALKKLTEKYKNADEINFSWADIYPNEFYKYFANKNFSSYNEIASKIAKSFEDNDEVKSVFADIEDTAEIVDLVNTLANQGTKIFVSAGNGGKESFNIVLLAKNVEGVGSLDENGQISEFCSSRKGGLTRHFEQGEYIMKAVKDGINYTGGNHCDFKCNLSEIFPLTGKKLSSCRISEKEFKDLIEYKKRGERKFYELFGELADKEKVMSVKQAYTLFNTEYEDNYKQIYLAIGDWTPYKVNSAEELTPCLTKIKGTSFTSPIRAARYALNMSMDGII